MPNSQSKIHLPMIPGACNFDDQIQTLFVVQLDGSVKVIRGSYMSGGNFSRIVTSRPGIITLMAPVAPTTFRRDPWARTLQESLREPGLLILPTDFREGDWVVAAEEQLATCDPGTAHHLLLGELPLGVSSVTALSVQIANTLHFLENSNCQSPFEQFTLWPVKPEANGGCTG
jgi:hypothetical protein